MKYGTRTCLAAIQRSEKFKDKKIVTSQEETKSLDDAHQYSQSMLRNGCGDKCRITQILRPEGATMSVLRTSSNFLFFLLIINTFSNLFFFFLVYTSN